MTSSIRLPCMPTSGRLPVLDAEQQQRIAEEFQAKLLGFRLSPLSGSVRHELQSLRSLPSPCSSLR